MLQVTTESGAKYEFENRDGQEFVRRVNPDYEKRGDGDWQVLLDLFPEIPTVGQSLVIVMESLARYGQDDHGTPPELVSNVTTRRTTPIIEVKEN